MHAAGTVNALLPEHAGALYVAAYNGLGDVLLHGPILKEIVRRIRGPIFIAENPMLRLFHQLGIAELGALQEAPIEMRRFAWTPEGAATSFARLKIRTILSFRRDRGRSPCFAEALAALRREGVSVADYGAFFTDEEQASMHVYNLSVALMRRLHVEVSEVYVGWLLRSITDPQWAPLDSMTRAREAGGPRGGNTIGFYLGASNAVKRLPADFWLAILRHTRMVCCKRLLLFAGASEEEQLLGQDLASALRTEDVELISGLPLYEITMIVAGLSFLVSGDSFMLHMAESLDVPVLGIYSASDPRMYGPQGAHSRVVSSAYYPKCPRRNVYGNCSGWDDGCETNRCRDLDLDRTAAIITEMAASRG